VIWKNWLIIIAKTTKDQPRGLICPPFSRFLLVQMFGYWQKPATKELTPWSHSRLTSRPIGLGASSKLQRIHWYTGKKNNFPLKILRLKYFLKPCPTFYFELGKTKEKSDHYINLKIVMWFKINIRLNQTFLD